MADLIEKTIKSDRIYEGKILNLRLDSVELPDRKYSKREIVEHVDSSAIVLVKDGKLLLTKHYRNTVDDIIYEIPAGMIEVGETPIDAASRELEEETGYISDDIELIYSLYSSPGYSTEKIYFFKANPPFDIGNKIENLEIEFIDLERVKKLIYDLEIIDMKTVIAYYIAKDLI